MGPQRDSSRRPDPRMSVAPGDRHHAAEAPDPGWNRPSGLRGADDAAHEADVSDHRYTSYECYGGWFMFVLTTTKCRLKIYYLITNFSCRNQYRVRKKPIV